MPGVVSQWWFWFIIIGLIFIIIALIWYAVERTFNWYHWLFLIGGIILLIIGFIGAFTSGSKSDDDITAAAIALSNSNGQACSAPVSVPMTPVCPLSTRSNVQGIPIYAATTPRSIMKKTTVPVSSSPGNVIKGPILNTSRPVIPTQTLSSNTGQTSFQIGDQMITIGPASFNNSNRSYVPSTSMSSMSASPRQTCVPCQNSSSLPVAVSATPSPVQYLQYNSNPNSPIIRPVLNY